MAAAAEAAVSAERASSAIENEQMELIETLRGEALKFVEVLKKSNEKANAVAAELHKTQASLTQARDSLRQREETSVAELARLTAIVESEKRCVLYFPNPNTVCPITLTVYSYTFRKTDTFRSQSQKTRSRGDDTRRGVGGGG